MDAAIRLRDFSVSLVFLRVGNAFWSMSCCGNRFFGRTHSRPEVSLRSAEQKAELHMVNSML